MHSVRYAHCEGYTDVCFAENNKFITTGEDGDIRIWNGFDDMDNTSIRVGDKCFAIAYKSGKIYVADELNELKKYDLETNEYQGVITSFTLPITCVTVNKSNTYLVCGSSDFEIHLVDLNTLKTSSLQGHDAPILSICYDPMDKYVVSSSCDGTCRFWSTQNLTTVKTLSNLHPKSNDFIDSSSWCRIAWHKDGGLIAVPYDKEVHFYERETWICKLKISLPNENSSDSLNASITCFSPDGKYVLVATNTQMVYIHSIINKSLVFKYSYKKNIRICSLAWNPSNQNEIIFCDINGQMGLIKPVIKEDSSSQPEEEAVSSNKTASKKTASKKDNKTDNLEMEDLLDLLDNDETSNDSSRKGDLKSPSKKRKRLSDNDDDQDKRSNDDVASNMDENDEDDLESLEKLKAKAFSSAKKDVMLLDDDFESETKQAMDETIHEKKKEQPVLAPLQPSFQSGSTPLNLPERYMCWNSVGLITQFNKEGDESIDIEFHNASYHHTIHMKNQFGYTMADMSKEVICLASPGLNKNEDDENAEMNLISSINKNSKLTCIMINSNDLSKEWSVEMQRKEFIRCVCASKRFVACATSRRFLRIYYIGGTQKEIISIPGTPISMSSYENSIFIAYHISNLNIGYSIYHIDDHLGRDSENGILPQSDNAKLEWVGFSDEGNPYCYDSNGYLYAKCLTLSKMNTWTPLSYLRSNLHHKSDNYWIVGVAERNQMIKAILCKSSKHPQVFPRPNLTMVNISLPLSEPETEKTQMEQEFWKNKYFGLSMKNYDFNTGNLDWDQDDLNEKIDKFEASSREVLMKLFMFSCKNNKEQRAFEVASIMDLTALQLAIKYATKTRALVLAQNLNILAEKKAELELAKERMAQQEEYKSNYYSTDYNHSNRYNEYDASTGAVTTQRANDNMDEDIVQIESSTYSSTKPKQTTTQTQENNFDTQSSVDMDSSLKSTCITPTIPLTTTRLNPFAKGKTTTPLNDSSKSIINEIEEKVNRQHQSASKEKDTWKPTPPTKKLTKSKLSNNGTPNSSINSFFASPSLPKN